MTHPQKYWYASLKLVLCLLSLWFVAGFVCSILLREWLDAHAPRMGHAPFGFWMAQQGSIICFLVLLLTYALAMNRLDARYGYREPTKKD